ncbi:hypothetical protein K469DRAFT_799882 [Zopfia rhizophila CBS 207.26]|uniref:Uncharacterized protein n=1 Tax=Zopfia rhizophila CBS 207.26 TaxID=1314779 RepID=A0A6A6EN68_9PEZI|nr:hypothetical protein K469DRAFT_799882 [Zopfia rhizophila CBS 207.26]
MQSPVRNMFNDDNNHQRSTCGARTAYPAFEGGPAVLTVASTTHTARTRLRAPTSGFPSLATSRSASDIVTVTLMIVMVSHIALLLVAASLFTPVMLLLTFRTMATRRLVPSQFTRKLLSALAKPVPPML